MPQLGGDKWTEFKPMAATFRSDCYLGEPNSPALPVWHVVWWSLLLIVITFVAYIPAAFCGFIWDDDDYVTENRALRSSAGLSSIWLRPGATPQYYPMVHTTFWLEFRAWGLAPMGYHLTNVLLHGLNSVLLWRVVRKLQIPGAWLAAAIFALHPVHVESVAWVTERKNVLSGFFYLVAALGFLHVCLPDARAPQGESRSPRRVFTRPLQVYLFSCLAFVFALLSKTVTATLPAALLLLLWWKRGGKLQRNDVLAMVPPLAIGVAFGLLTAYLEYEQVSARGREFEFSPVERCLIAGRVPWFYLAKLLWPTDLTFIYPRWQIDASCWWQYLFPAATLLLLVLLFHFRRQLSAGPLVAVLFFGGTLFPVLGFLNVYPMRFSFVANHFQYLASIGPIVVVAAGTASLMRCRQGPAWIHLAPLGVLLILASLTWNNCFAYLSLETLWLDTLAKNPNAWLAHNELGAMYDKLGDAGLVDNDPRAQSWFATADKHLSEAIRLNPNCTEAYLNQARLRIRQEDYAGAVETLSRGMEAERARFSGLEIAVPQFQESLGAVYLLMQNYDKAVACFEENLRLTARFGGERAEYKVIGYTKRAHLYIATALEKKGDKAGAMTHLQKALALDADFSEARKILNSMTPATPRVR